MQTRKQKYAAQIYEQVTAVPDGDRKKYGTMALKLPTLVRSAGLVQTLAFVEARSKDSDPQRKLLDDLAKATGYDNRQKLFKEAREAALPGYILLTEQVMEALEWYKRYAQSVLKVEMTDEVPEA